MFKINDKVVVNNRWVAIIKDTKVVKANSIYNNGKQYLIHYIDNVGSDYMSESSLKMFVEK